MNEAEARSRRSSIPMRGPTSSSRSARKASRSRKASSRSPRCPAACWLKVGKMRAPSARSTRCTTTCCRGPTGRCVTQNLVGGEEGITDAGLSVVAADSRTRACSSRRRARSISGERRASSRRTSAATSTYVGHLRGYRDLTEATNLDLGVSFALRPQRRAVRTTHARGCSASTRPSATGRCGARSTSAFIGRTELIWSRPRRSRRRRPADAFGYYVCGDYQFARRWFAGARYDWSERADDASLARQRRRRCS